MSNQISLILHDIRSAQNVGAIFRTADACGVDKIYLTGYTPAPVDQFERSNSKVAKAALGAEKNIEWEKIESISGVIDQLKKGGVQLIAIEQSPSSVDYKKVELRKPTCFLLGNEVDGLSAEILAKCDLIAEIPMVGKKESLNVSVSAGIALFRILNI